MRADERPTIRFLAHYYHDGAQWSVDIYAYDWEDAEIRCRKLGLQLDGEHVLTIPVIAGSWLANLLCWVCNAVRTTP